MKKNKRPDKKTLSDFHVLIESDTDFAAYGRMLQSKWRINNNISIGTYKKKQKNGLVKEIELGNFIEKNAAFKNGSNFLTDEIREVVKTELLNKQKGAKIEVNRLYRNLLSSQPLAFNLFATLSKDKLLATKFFSDLFPDRIKEVTEILFEHSPGRRDHEYTGDSSAFDVFVIYISPNGLKGFAGIEVKYAENLKDTPSSHKTRYVELTTESQVFVDDISKLKQKPIQQIWRDHLLSISLLKHKTPIYQDGFFIYLYPKDNTECENAVAKYIEQFKSYNPDTKYHDEKLTGFYPRYMKNFMIKLRQLISDDWTKELLQRYFDDTTMIEETRESFQNAES